MLVKKHWHDFKVGQKLKWHLYGSHREMEVVGIGPNYISAICTKCAYPAQHPVRIWEDELKNLEVING